MHIDAGVRRRHVIGLTPLIDVVFILLIFFMLASSMMDWRSIALETAASGGAVADRPVSAVVIVQRDGSLLLDDRRFVDAQAAAGALREGLASGDWEAVVVRSVAGVRFGQTVAVIDALSGAGIASLAMATVE